MSTQLFSEAMNEIGDKYYEEATDYTRRRKPHSRILWSAAACLAAGFAAACLLLPDALNRQGVAPAEHSHGVVAEHSDSDDMPPTVLETRIPPTTPEIRISMSEIAINAYTGFLRTDRARYHPETDEAVVWGKEKLAAYYGADLTPAYIPAGLSASPHNSTATVYIGQNGAVTEDTVWLGFYHAYYEDGSPKLTEAVSARCGFSVTASKIGIENDCVYLLPEHEVKTSDIAGTAVTFGYRSVPYGPYDPETHEPLGYYDMYLAEFEQDGVEYQIVAEQMELEELVRVAASVICGETAVIGK